MGVFEDTARSFASGNPVLSNPPRLIDFLITISKGIDLLEGRPPRHGIRIAVLSALIAQKLSLSPRQITHTVHAALLHDIGLADIACNLFFQLSPEKQNAQSGEKSVFYHHTLINSRIVGNPEDYGITPMAQELLNNHPQASIAHFVSQARMSSEVKDIVMAHHELYDGSGYPYGLSGDQIPIEARILTLADTVEAVMGEVTGLNTRQSAVERFLEFKTQDKFDPDVVQAYSHMVKEVEHDKLLKQLYSPDAETLLLSLTPARHIPLSGSELLILSQATAQLSDKLTPQYTTGHGEKVAQLSFEIARRMDIPMEQCGELLLAGYLHDIGMLAIPLHTLLKPDKLTSEEWTNIHEHSHHSGQVLKHLPGFSNIMTWVTEHHERINGSGYPQRKKNFEVSIGSRILALADVFSALTSNRAYRPYAFEPLDALPVIGQGRDRLYDNHIVNVLRSVILEAEIPVP